MRKTSKLISWINQKRAFLPQQENEIGS